MAYSDQTEFPRGIQYGDLTSAVVIADDVPIRVSSIVLANASGTGRTVTFQDTAGTPNTLFVAKVPINGTVVLPGFYTAAGLQVAAGDSTTHVTVLYYDD